MKVSRTVVITLAISLGVSIPRSSSATVQNFTFLGTITSFSAREETQPPTPLTDLANPGDPFTGTGFFDTEPGPFPPGFFSVGFFVKVNGFTWGVSTDKNDGFGLGGTLNLTATKLGINVVAEPGQAQAPYISEGVFNLSLSLTSGTGCRPLLTVAMVAMLAMRFVHRTAQPPLREKAEWLSLRR